MIAFICGNTCIWKPSSKTPLSAIACQNIIEDVLKANEVPEGVCCLVFGNREVGDWISNDTRIPLVSATGSTRMGKIVGATVASRLGRSLLELGAGHCRVSSDKLVRESLPGLPP